MAEDVVIKHVVIRGIVQGVFYRKATKQKADSLNVTGWVRNQDDGSVEALFQGNSENVSAMIEWCWQGPRASRVDGIEELPFDKAEERYERFIIR